jgi:hypothetical protein
MILIWKLHPTALYRQLTIMSNKTLRRYHSNLICLAFVQNVDAQ